MENGKGVDKEQVRLRSAELNDVDILSVLLKDKEITSAIPGSEQFKSTLGVHDFVTRVMKKELGNEMHFVACVGSKIVGMCALHDIELDLGYAKIGYWIGRPYWGKGYGKAEVKLLLDEARAFGITNIEAESLESNERSSRLLKSLGFEVIEERQVDAGNMKLFRLELDGI